MPKNSEYDDWVLFAQRVYGKTLDLSAVEKSKWRTWYGFQHRLRVRFADGMVREGVIGIARGPVPRFVFKRNSASNAGVDLTASDHVLATQGRHGYLPVGRVG